MFLALTVVFMMLGGQSAADPEISPEVMELVRSSGGKLDSATVAKLNALADAGDVSAVELLGEAYNQGGAPGGRDPARACRYFERSAKTRADGAHNLATCVYMGEGQPKDLPRARLLYRQALDGGYAKAGCALGNMMIAGEGGAIDRPTGLALCKTAAEAGEADAQTDYGGYLLMGTGTAKDAVAARRWLTAAAERNHANAAFLLGQIYWNGDGTPEDRPAAARWWRIAHDAGRPDAAFHLGQEALSRALVEKNGKREIDLAILPEVRRWYMIAVARDPDSRKRSDAADLVKNLDELAARE